MRLLQLVFLVALASGVSAILIYLTGVSNLDWPFRLSSEDLEALKSLQIHFQKCVNFTESLLKLWIKWRSCTDKILLGISARSHPSPGQGVLSNYGMSRQGHTPLQTELLSGYPSRSLITAARIASEKILSGCATGGELRLGEFVRRLTDRAVRRDSGKTPGD